jgi:xylose isomerase
MRTEDPEDVWVSAAACMRTYLILKEKAKKFRADPEVQEALRAARADQLAVPTLAPGESWSDLEKDEFDLDAAAARGYHYSRLNQLAMEHLLGVR